MKYKGNKSQSDGQICEFYADYLKSAYRQQPTNQMLKSFMEQKSVNLYLLVFM